MFKGVRVVAKARRLVPYVCDTCRSKASRTPIGDQRRWISRNHIAKIRTAEEEWQERAEEITEGKRISMLDMLERRGLINQIVGTREQLDHLMTNRRVGVYCGVDPTAPSLHVGHMVPFMVLGWLYIHGYPSYFLLGGATARIGDPTDRLKARDKVVSATRVLNMSSMHNQLKNLGSLIERHASRRGYGKEWAWQRALVNNGDWYKKLPFLEFLRLVGSVARIGPMLGRDTVKNRLEKGDGMSFAEFTYPLVQAYDWWELFQRGVQVQVGGADQFGNILAGADIVKHMDKEHRQHLPPPKYGPQDAGPTGLASTSNERALKVTLDPMGFTVPLLTTSSGEKFGKSAGNAVWLDKDMTSSYDLYQFFLRSADADVEKYLKLLTFMPLTEIAELMEQHRQDESKRVAQHRLAKEFVELVHGLTAAEQAEQEHRSMFKKNISISELQKTANSASAARPTDINPSLNKHAAPPRLEENLSSRATLPASLVHGQHLTKIMWSAGLVATRSEAQRLINNKGVYIGGQSDARAAMDDTLTYAAVTSGLWEDVQKFVIDDSLLILRIGKWKRKIISIVPDEEFTKAGLSCPGWGAEEHAMAFATTENTKSRKMEAEES